VTYDTNIGTTL